MKKFILIFVFLPIFLPIIVFAENIQQPTVFDQVNQKVCDRFEQDVLRLAAIMEELRRRKGITETKVAFGGIDDQIKSADYQITYVAEALAYQRAQKYSTKAQLRNSLEVLKNKIYEAKNEVKKAL